MDEPIDGKLQITWVFSVDECVQLEHQKQPVQKERQLFCIS